MKKENDEEIEINVKDIKKSIYFITCLAQLQKDGTMYGSLNSKGDLMGGIFDRWINTIPESIIFNKIILPKASKGKNVQVITDYYIYDPAKDKAGIAPDVIGINIDSKPIPFAVFNEKWEPVKNMPQIEIKTNRKKHKMVSLRNQGYDKKYLIFAETDFDVDYLVPLIKEEFYSDKIHKELKMNNKVFIISNKEKHLEQTPDIDLSKRTIGRVKILYITTAKYFMDNSIKCNENEGIEYFVGIKKRTNSINTKVGKLEKFGELLPNGLFRFNQKWYEYEDLNEKSSRNGKIKTVDFYFSSIKNIEILAINKGSINIRTSEKIKIFDEELEKDTVYIIELGRLSRGKTEEYFISKNTIPFLIDKEKQLTNELEKIIENN